MNLKGGLDELVVVEMKRSGQRESHFEDLVHRWKLIWGKSSGLATELIFQ